MNKAILTFIIICNVFILTGQTKQVPVMDFTQLKPLLNKQTDTVYVVNFWATWCKPCIEEIPSFLVLSSEMRKQKVKFIFVSLDFLSQKESRLLPFIDNYKITDQVILLNDPKSNNWIPQVNAGWSGSLPATLIYNATTRSFFEEQMEYDRLKSEINLKLKP